MSNTEQETPSGDQNSTQPPKRAPRQTRPNIFQGRYSEFAQSDSGWKGWSGSFLVHVLFFFLFLVVLSQVPKGQNATAQDPGVVVEGDIVVVNTKENESDKDFLEKDDFQNPTEQQENSADSGQAAAANNMQELLKDLPGLEMSESDNSTNGSALIGLSPNDLNSVRQGAASNSTIGESQIRFGGLIGKGSRFVFVVDQSGSMAEERGRLMNAAKADLRASLDSLPEQNQFQIIFYNAQPTLFRKGGSSVVKMHFGTDSNKKEAEKFIRGIIPDGYTDHYPALVSALKLNPDVVFLLTDADDGLSPRQLEELSRLNKSGASINVIAFGSESRPTNKIQSFKRLARKNRGSFLYKSIRQAFRN